MDDINSGLDEQSPEVAEMATSWPLIDALVGGTLAMRGASKTYLPKFPAEAEEDYKDRLNASTLFPAFTRTTEVLAAKPFARPIKITGVDADVESMFGNIDLMGTGMHAFAGQVMLNAMRYGLHGVLVDSPPRAEGIKTIADEKKAGVRPYLAQYHASSILGWEAQKGAYGTHLTQLRLKERVSVPVGRFGREFVDQIRVLEPGKWEIWRQTKSSDGTKPLWEIVDHGKISIGVVPFVFFYGLREAFGIGRPPLLELGHLNVEHWQSASDQRNILHSARIPILFAKGFGTTDKIKIGSKAATTAKDEKAELKYVEHTGAAIEAGRQSILDLEDRMRMIGAELLTERAGMVTARQVIAEEEDNRSTMQKITEEFEASLETCLALMALWGGNKSADPEVALHKDFGAATKAETATAGGGG